jgi:hypothetical protein
MSEARCADSINIHRRISRGEDVLQCSDSSHRRNLPLAAENLSGLPGAKRDDGINAHGAAGRQPAGDEGNDEERQRDRGKGERGRGRKPHRAGCS